MDPEPQVLERGAISFLYRPVVVAAGEAVPRPRDLSRVQRLYLLLEPAGSRRCRLLVIGRKQLPDPAEPGHARYWGYVDTAGGARAAALESLEGYTYATRTRGARVQPGARVAGEGVYAIVRHEDHTHLEYELRGPAELGRLQETLHIGPRASYILIARNPDRRSGQRRFVAADPGLLDEEGLDLILISAAEEPYSLGTNSSAAEFMQ